MLSSHAGALWSAFLLCVAASEPAGAQDKFPYPEAGKSVDTALQGQGFYMEGLVLAFAGYDLLLSDPRFQDRADCVLTRYFWNNTTVAAVSTLYEPAHRGQNVVVETTKYYTEFCKKPYTPGITAQKDGTFSDQNLASLYEGAIDFLGTIQFLLKQADSTKCILELRYGPNDRTPDFVAAVRANPQEPLMSAVFGLVRQHCGLAWDLGDKAAKFIGVAIMQTQKNRLSVYRSVSDLDAMKKAAQDVLKDQEQKLDDLKKK